MPIELATLNYIWRLCRRFLKGFRNVFKIFEGYVKGFWKVLGTFSKFLGLCNRFLEGFRNVFKNVLQKRLEILFKNFKKSLKKPKNKTFSKPKQNVP